MFILQKSDGEDTYNKLFYEINGYERRTASYDYEFPCTAGGRITFQEREDGIENEDEAKSAGTLTE